MAEDRLQVIGVVQEQHAERTRLYRQWRQFKWPIVQDALNLLDIKVVPLAIALDEQGRVVSHNANPKFIEGWLQADQKVAAADAASPAVDKGLQVARDEFLWNGQDGLNAAIKRYESLLETTHADDPAAHFEAAVCYRQRFETAGNPDDFQRAIDHWSRALAIDPNQYIYRRRIQQYGARLGKPYPFYDWVETARQEIRDRGEEPVELVVEISGAEIASPLRKFSADESPADFAEAARIDADDRDLFEAHVVVVPKRVRPGAAARVHVLVRPTKRAKWNNAAGEPTVCVLGETAGAELSKRKFEQVPQESTPESTENRRFEFEVRLAADATQPVEIRGAVLAAVCDNESGQCLYLRKPFRLLVEPAVDK